MFDHFGSSEQLDCLGVIPGPGSWKRDQEPVNAKLTARSNTVLLCRCEPAQSPKGWRPERVAAFGLGTRWAAWSPSNMRQVQ